MGGGCADHVAAEKVEARGKSGTGEVYAPNGENDMITEAYLITVPKKDVGPSVQSLINHLRLKMVETDREYHFCFYEHKEMQKWLRLFKKYERSDCLGNSGNS